jgi:predicted PurR-regulated permease PerM
MPSSVTTSLDEASISIPANSAFFVFAPGLISAVFYRRRPTATQIGLGIAFTIALSGLLGYIQDVGTSRVWENVILAIVLGLLLYLAILAYLVYVYIPKREKRSASPQSTRLNTEP